MERKELDLKLRLLAGKPIYIPNFGNIVPHRIGSIIDIGYTDYMGKLFFILSALPDFLPPDSDLRNEEELSKLNIMDIIYMNKDDSMKDALIEAMKIVLGRDDLIYHIPMNTIYAGDLGSFEYINKENFDELKKVLQYQHGLTDPKQDQDFNLVSDKARQIAEKFKKNKKAVEEAKKKSGTDSERVTFPDIISAITAKSNSINKLNVWDLTLYQLYDEFKRLQMIESFDIAVNSLMAGASSKEIKMKHWSLSID